MLQYSNVTLNELFQPACQMSLHKMVTTFMYLNHDSHMSIGEFCKHFTTFTDFVAEISVIFACFKGALPC